MIKTINVTANDILMGIRHDCNKCPVARAIHRVAKNKDINVTVNVIYVPGKYNVISTPKEVRDFILDFDGKKQVKPFKFKLDIPNDWFK